MNAALIVRVIAGSIMSGTSLLYATLGEIVGRAGIVNLGLEGVMLVGAASGFAGTALTDSPYLGIAAAAWPASRSIWSSPISSLRAAPTNSRPGLTDVLRRWAERADRPAVRRQLSGACHVCRFPGSSRTDRGAARELLRFGLFGVPAALLAWWLLFRTRWGLGLRTVGESPAWRFRRPRPQRLQYQA